LVLYEWTTDERSALGVVKTKGAGKEKEKKEKERSFHISQKYLCITDKSI